VHRNARNATRIRIAWMLRSDGISMQRELARAEELKSRLLAGTSRRAEPQDRGRGKAGRLHLGYRAHGSRGPQSGERVRSRIGLGAPGPAQMPPYGGSPGDPRHAEPPPKRADA
jgi:hypothetical protein